MFLVWESIIKHETVWESKTKYEIVLSNMLKYQKVCNMKIKRFQEGLWLIPMGWFGTTQNHKFNRFLKVCVFFSFSHHPHVCLHLHTLTFKTWGGKGLPDKIMGDRKNDFFTYSRLSWRLMLIEIILFGQQQQTLMIIWVSRKM